MGFFIFYLIFSKTAPKIFFKIGIIIVILNIYKFYSHNITDELAWQKLQLNIYMKYLFFSIIVV